MSLIARFGEYAAAFEKGFESDDWSVVEPYLSEDVVYDAPLPAPFGGHPEGREAVVAYFKQVLDALDRRFDLRQLRILDGPSERDGAVWVSGACHYEARGVPDLDFVVEETAPLRRRPHRPTRRPLHARDARRTSRRGSASTAQPSASPTRAEPRR